MCSNELQCQRTSSSRTRTTLESASARKVRSARARNFIRAIREKYYCNCINLIAEYLRLAYSLIVVEGSQKLTPFVSPYYCYSHNIKRYRLRTLTSIQYT